MHWGVNLQDFHVLCPLTLTDCLDYLKCSQRQKWKYLWSPLFRCLMCIGFFALCLLLWVAIQYLFSCIWFIFWFPYFVIIIIFISLSYLLNKKNHSHFLIFLLHGHIFLYSYYFVQIWSSWKQDQLLFSLLSEI